MRLILLGFGNVGQGFIEILHEKAADLATRHGLKIQVVGVATHSRGILYHPDGLDLAALLSAAEAGTFSHYPNSEGLQRNWLDAVDLIQNAVANVVIEASPTNLQTAQPALTYIETALETGKHVITANKGPVALAYTRLKALADSKGRAFRIEATVMAGTPSMALGMEQLAGCKIEAVRGIVNGTTNYILSQMEQGLPYETALKEAQELGYAETDPTGDVDGWDAAGKVLIMLAAFFGVDAKMGELEVKGITKISQADIAAAQASGERYKLIASANAEGGSVKPLRLPLSDPLAHVNGASNAITFTTDLMGNVTLIGAGAGRKETGYALLADLLAIRRAF